MKRKAARFGCALIACVLAQPSAAQTDIRMTPIAAPVEPGAIPLGTGSVPGMPGESWFEDRGLRVVRNVSRATLTPVLPAPGKATGAAAIVLPGGGFRQLSMDNEGWLVARKLAEHGVAAFVLKYRTVSTPAELEGYRQQVIQQINDVRSGKATVIALPDDARADAIAALTLVRSRAGEWAVDPDRVGLLGFSAGGITALAVTVDPLLTRRPAFLGHIYAPLAAVAVPKDAPPLYAAVAADDRLMFGQAPYDLFGSWRQADRPFELHVHQSGGHGYGLGSDKDTTKNWIEGFVRWLSLNAMLEPNRK